jgi:hypothetical protein
MSKVLDIGDLCVWCGDHTSFGSGKFVNRIPVYTDMENTSYNEDPILAPKYTHVEGYGCEACYEDEENN